MLKKVGVALKKMSQRALMRGDRSQSEMIENHGVFGMRNNLLNDTPSYKKESIGLDSTNKNILVQNKEGNQNDRKNNANTKVVSSQIHIKKDNDTSKKLGSSIIDALQ
jgi:hypothetical protein